MCHADFGDHMLGGGVIRLFHHVFFWGGVSVPFVGLVLPGNQQETTYWGVPILRWPSGRLPLSPMAFQEPTLTWSLVASWALAQLGLPARCPLTVSFLGGDSAPLLK